MKQHVQWASGTNQSHICDLSEKPSLNTVSADNTSPYQVTGQPDTTFEHDKVPSSHTEPEPVFSIPLHTKVPPQPQGEHYDAQIQSNLLHLENTMTIEIPNILLQHSTTILPHPPSNQEIHQQDNTENPSEDYYIIEYDRPSSPSQNHHLQTIQILNCYRDTELQQYIENGWHRVTCDVAPENPQFMDTPGLNFDTNSSEPEVFFNQFFDDRMFTIIAQETNNYAHQQIARIMGGRDEIQQFEHYSHKRHTRLGTWRDINEAYIKIFIVHILIMSSVRKPALYNYL